MMHAFPQTFTLPQERGVRAATVPAGPLTPAAYLRLRREAAGLSIRAVAGMLARKADDVAPAIDLVTVLEVPGNTARRAETLDSLRDVFPFDPDVYRQLGSEPPHLHPRICRGCGCSHWDPCGDGQDACGWATDTACTRCLPDVAPVECAH
jgi:hypothetical protein